MPIYAYKCGSCGHAKDVLQRVSDQPLSVCPACGAEAFSKQVTAAGFQLKGSGWYVTDFRNASGSSASSTASSPSSTAPASTASSTPAAEPAKSGSDTGGKSDGPTASAGCGGGCACH